ncbi:MAG TPA: hypothetical protein VMI31_06420 [Fimbriimonadaceae bacterium]|nr:hypothetical protein [Fimbriimonadaceae bacterium]
MPISNALKRVAGLFVEIPNDPNAPASAPAPSGKAMSDADFLKMMQAQPSPATAAPAGRTVKTVEQIVKDSPGPNLDEIQVPAAPQVQPMHTDGTVDFKAIYSLAAVTDAPFTAEQLLDLLATLPAELPLEARRQTVKITIQAMAKTVNVTPEIIVADASRKLAALAAYEQSYGKQADEFVAKSEADIAALEAQIAAKKQSIEDAKTKHEKMNKGCTDESNRLDDVLEFFSLDVAPSKYAP